MAMLISIFVIAQTEVSTRNFDSFTSVEVRGSIDLLFKPSSSFYIEIKGNYPEDIISELKDGDLVIYHKKGKNWISNEWNTIGRGYVAIIHAPSLYGITSVGSGAITIEGILKSDNLSISLAGSGNIVGQINVGKLEIENSGSSNIRLNGNADKVDIKSSGSGNIQCFEFVMDECQISKSGSGNAQITVNNTLIASISGSGNLTYKGSPKKITKSVSGTGKIRKA
jgi:cytoskeletal protein CcmA (bactofilin family)